MKASNNSDFWGPQRHQNNVDNFHNILRIAPIQYLDSSVGNQITPVWKYWEEWVGQQQSIKHVDETVAAWNVGLSDVRCTVQTNTTLDEF